MRRMQPDDEFFTLRGLELTEKPAEALARVFVPNRQADGLVERENYSVGILGTGRNLSHWFLHVTSWVEDE